MTFRPRQTLPTRLRNLVIQVTDDGSRTLVHTDTDDAYHSASGALSETCHVYLNNSGIAERMRRRRTGSVLEIGLGIGMGLLVTVDAAFQTGSELSYVALENDWLPADVLAQVQPDSWVTDSKLAHSFLEFRRGLPPHVEDGIYHWSPGEQQRVTICVGDALSYQFDDQMSFDAIYFDPFAPSSNLQLWQTDLLSRLSQVLKDDGRLVTYCVNRQVRESMAQAGFNVEKVPGPSGGKREVLIATKCV